MNHYLLVSPDLFTAKQWLSCIWRKRPFLINTNSKPEWRCFYYSEDQPETVQEFVQNISGGRLWMTKSQSILVVGFYQKWKKTRWPVFLTKSLQKLSQNPNSAHYWAVVFLVNPYTQEEAIKLKKWIEKLKINFQIIKIIPVWNHEQYYVWLQKYTKRHGSQLTTTGVQRLLTLIPPYPESGYCYANHLTRLALSHSKINERVINSNITPYYEYDAFLLVNYLFNHQRQLFLQTFNQFLWENKLPIEYFLGALAYKINQKIQWLVFKKQIQSIIFRRLNHLLKDIQQLDYDLKSGHLYVKILIKLRIISILQVWNIK